MSQTPITATQARATQPPRSTAVVTIPPSTAPSWTSATPTTQRSSYGAMATDTRSRAGAAYSGTSGLETRMYYPTGEQSSSVLAIEKSAQGAPRVGKPFTYQIKVTNLTNAPLQGVVVQETLPGSFTISNVEGGGAGGAGGMPTTQPMAHAGMMHGEAGAMGAPHVYPIGELGPKETRIITVSGTPTQAGALSSCISVDYNPTLCSTAMVINPELKLNKQIISATGAAAGAGDICEPLTIRYTVTNTGTGPLTGVRVDDPLPEGLVTENGSNRVAFNVGNLPEGQSKAIDVKVKAQRAGEFSSAATATADEDVSARSEAAPMAFKAPKLEVSVKAPEKEYLGQTIKYEVTVRNIGDAPARKPLVRIDSGGAVAAGEEGGAQMAAARTGGGPLASQDIGELGPGQSKTVTVPFNARGEGDMRINATASDPCAEAVTAAGVTRIVAIPALLLETVDDHDPIRVGENVIYTITVLNQGLGPDKNVRIVATIPDGEEYVSASGATTGTVEGNKISFAPVPTLNSKQTVEWKVIVKATKVADVRFRVDMSSDSLGQDAGLKLEPTRLY